MTKGIFYTTETASVTDAAVIMETNKVRRLPALNEQKRMTGMLSTGDLSHARERQLCGGVLDVVAARRMRRGPSSSGKHRYRWKISSGSDGTQLDTRVLDTRPSPGDTDHGVECVGVHLRSQYDGHEYMGGRR